MDENINRFVVVDRIKLILMVLFLQKLLELKSNIKQSNTDAVFVKPNPPSPVTKEIQRGTKRSHDVGKFNESNDYYSHQIQLSFLFQQLRMIMPL